MPNGLIRPGAVFTDQHGETAQLHGIGIQKFGDAFYAWGEDKAAGQTFSGVACYRSQDLATWTSLGHALSVSSEDADLRPDRVIERPKVLYNPGTRKYVMFLHVDSKDYSAARVGYAVGEAPEGPFDYVGSARPPGHESRDIGVFQEEDGTAYLLSEDRPNGLHILRLADDYLSVTELVCTLLKDDGSHGYESPALVKVQGVYYLFGSDLTGWSTNDNKVSTAESLSGPWSTWSDIAPAGTATHDSQISAVLTIRGSEHTQHVYIGDRWDPKNLASSPPVWLPLEISERQATLRWVDAWAVDPATGGLP